MKTSDFRFLDRQRVRWAEIDAQQIVFNGHYLAYFDTAVAGYWRAMATPYAQTMAQLGGDLFVRKATLEYEASARYDDVIHTGIRCLRIGTSSMVFAAAVFRGETLLVKGELVYVFADPHAKTSKPVPPALRELLESFEAGRTMVDVSVDGWAKVGADARRIRTAVFIEEQGIAADREWDGADADPQCVHAVAYNRFGVPLATGRLLEHVPGVAKIGRMAVLQAMRGGGIGEAVLAALMQAGRQRGYREAVLHAQTSAAAFYRRAGFRERGEVFDEVGIPHIEMLRPL
jgi:YbgC/YbaW family acyl-CoA thioester hydrolase